MRDSARSGAHGSAHEAQVHTRVFTRVFDANARRTRNALVKCAHKSRASPLASVCPSGLSHFPNSFGSDRIDAIHTRTMDVPNFIIFFDDLAKTKRRQADLLTKEAQMYDQYVDRIRADMNKKRPASATDAIPAPPKAQKTTAAAGPSAAAGSPVAASGSKDVIAPKPAAAENAGASAPAKPERKMGPGMQYVKDNLAGFQKEHPGMSVKAAKQTLMNRFKAIADAQKEREKSEKAAAKAAAAKAKAASKPAKEKKPAATKPAKKPAKKEDSDAKSSSDDDDENVNDVVHQSSDEEGSEEVQVQSENEEECNEESSAHSGESDEGGE